MSDGAGASVAGRVQPISQFVLKVHSRCDLACDHCYVYEHVDQSWRRRPIAIEPAVARQAAFRIAQHAGTHHLHAVQVVLHGGEPLLLGERRLRELLTGLREQISPVTRLDLHLQTNGVRLTPALCDLFVEFDVRIGVSLDGDRASNDRHRQFADGRSSHAQVREALRLLREPEYQHVYSGILCTVDLVNDPISVFEALLDESPSRIDFLLPHANWDYPPPRPEGGSTAYADWLVRVFDRWVALGRPTSVRLFDSIEALAGGGVSQTEGIGPGGVGLLVIETDGEWEQVDSLKSAYEGAPATGMNVFDHSADEAAAHPAVAARQSGIAALCDTCLTCPVVERCGGGLYTHRYRSGTAFQNPSVYCADLMRLIDHIGEPGIPQATAAVRLPPSRQAPMDAGYSDLDAADLDAIADQPVNDELARHLARSRLMTTRILFAQAGELGSACGNAERRCAQMAWDLMCSLDRDAPEVVRTVLEHPFAREWAARRLGSGANCERFCVPDIAHLASFALSAAVRAGTQADLRVPLRDGVLYLPTLGAWRLDRTADRIVQVTLQDGVIKVLDGGDQAQLRLGEQETHDPAWSVAREIGHPDHRVLLEDLDPYRDGHQSAPADRQSAAEVQRWDRMLSSASAALEKWTPSYAVQTWTCVRALVPLVPDASGREISATSRHVFGAFGVALPARPEELAMSLVHETQHMILDTVLDRYDLIDLTDTRLIKVAWRRDARPPTAALHGVFAFLGMAEVANARSHGSDAESGKAHGQAIKYAEWAGDALDRLSEGGALPPIGRRFADGLQRRLRPLRK